MTQAIFLETDRRERELQEKGEHRLNVSGVLRILGVSRSGYCSWKNRLPGRQEQRRQRIKERIREIHEDSYQNYGAPKITEILNKEGEKISEKTVGNYMRQMGIKAQYIKPYTVTTIDPDFSSTLKNILNEQFNPDSPDEVWCSDITYIWTMEGFVYLTSIMDLYSRRIIGWVLSETLESKWVVQAVEKAKAERKVRMPRVLHSDYAEENTMPKFCIKSYTKPMFQIFSA